jgi:oligosaccharide translocation protein RFT1
VFSTVIFISLGIPIIYWKFIYPNDANLISLIQPFNICYLVIMIVLCAFLELFAESYFNINQYIELNFKTRTKIESIAGFLRCISQFVTVIIISPIIGLNKYDVNAYVFGYLIGQFMYSFTIFMLYWSKFSFKVFIPFKVDGCWFENNSWSYFKYIFIQQIFKNFLTIGDKFVITSLLSIETQGKYSFISNYGSLIARMLFFPIEDSTRITISPFFKNEKNIEQEKKDFIELSSCISNVCKIYIYLLTLLIIFAPLNTTFLLNLVFKNFVSFDVIEAFKLYWLYVVILAINGILEALIQSLFNSKIKVNQYSIFMFINSVIFLATLIILIGKFEYGLKGLIIANMLNMILRILYCFWSISEFIQIKEKRLNILFNLNISRYRYFIITSTVLTIIQYAQFHGDVKSFKQFIFSAAYGIVIVAVAIVQELKARKKDK